jgi:predicted phosphate transport protein (TIGR00153 family)
MNFSGLLKYFIPKEKKFYTMFNQAAENTIEASAALEKLINSPELEERRAIGLAIKAIEKKGDEFTNQIFDVLNRSFITPFDREDINELTSMIDDVVDLIYSLSTKIDIYRCTFFSTFMKEMVTQIHLGCLQIKVAVGGLEDFKHSNKVLKACKEINKMESRVDEYYHMAISSLFENEKDPIELIKQKEILLNIEKIANKIEDVSDVVKTILVKYA